MEMQFEGYIQQQPTYSHVGYTAAAVNHSVLDQNHMGLGLSLCITLVLTVAAMAARRHIVTRADRAIFAILIAGVAVFAAQSVYALAIPQWEIDPRFEQTLVNIETMTEKTEAWEREYGRLPTVDEWNAVFDIPEARDGWGARLAYKVLDEPARDGMMYVIQTSRDGLPGDYFRARSFEAGPDGLFHTEDDFYSLNLGILKHRKVDLSNLRHGRTARDPLPELPKPKSR